MNQMKRLIEAKTTKCKLCGESQVAWVQSKKTGKWYLVRAFRVDGIEMADPLAFHKCRAGTR